MICFIGCVKKKRGTPCAARDMYISTLFKYRVRYAESKGWDWYIISARYGLLPPDQLIAPYNETLKTKSDSEIRNWSMRVCTAAESMGIVRRGDTVMMLAGEEYSRYLKRRYKVINPFEGMAFGKQIQRMMIDTQGMK